MLHVKSLLMWISLKGCIDSTHNYPGAVVPSGSLQLENMLSSVQLSCIVYKLFPTALYNVYRLYPAVTYDWCLWVLSKLSGSYRFKLCPPTVVYLNCLLQCFSSVLKSSSCVLHHVWSLFNCPVYCSGSVQLSCTIFKLCPTVMYNVLTVHVSNSLV